MYISYFHRIYVFKRKYIIPLWSTFFLLTSSLLSQKTLRYGSANLVSVCWPWSAQFVIFSNCYLDPSANFLDCTRCQIPSGSISSQTDAFFSRTLLSRILNANYAVSWAWTFKWNVWSCVFGMSLKRIYIAMSMVLCSLVETRRYYHIHKLRKISIIYQSSLFFESIT